MVPGRRGEMIVRAVVREADQVGPQDRLHGPCVGGPRLRDPCPVLPKDVLGVWLHGGRHVGREGPWGGGPYQQRFTGMFAKREPNVDRGVRLVPVDVTLGQLVLGH